jgi:hypothetical protein
MACADPELIIRVAKISQDFFVVSTLLIICQLIGGLLIG